MTSAQRFLLVGLLPAAVLFFSRSVHDAFELPKFVLIVALVAVAAAMATVQTVSSGVLVVPQDRTTRVAVALGLAFVVATFASDESFLSLVGEYRRFQGLVSYSAYVVCFLLMVRTLSIRDVRRIALLLIGATALAAGYAILQAEGLDPFVWGGLGRGSASTLGNSNFAGAWFGISLPLVVWGALLSDAKPSHRAAVGAIAGLVVGGIFAAGALQGYMSGAAGLCILLVAWLLERGGGWRRRGVPVVGAGALLCGAVVGISFITGSGPLGFVGTQVGSVLRKLYWQAAVSMFGQHPVTGVGLDRFRGYFPSHRPPETIDFIGLHVNVDEAHSVPLAMFAEGGLILGLLYLAFVSAVGLTLLGGLRRLEGQRRMLLGAVGGAWAAYQVQSAVSIDVPALALTQWVMAASIVVLAGKTDLVTVPMPGLRSKASLRGRAKAGMARRRAAVARVTGALAVVALGGLAFALADMWSADAALKSALAAERSGAGEAAAARADEAVAVGWWPQYWYEASRIVNEPRGDAESREMLKQAIARDKRYVHAWVALARSYRATGEVGPAWDAYERVLDLDPLTPRYQAEYGESLARGGRAEDAVPLLLAAVRRDPSPQYWLVLGRAYDELGREADAMMAFEQVLATATEETDPGIVQEAERKLDQIRSSLWPPVVWRPGRFVL